LREHVVIRKIIGTLRNRKSTGIYGTLMSLMATGKQRGLNPYIDACPPYESTLRSPFRKMALAREQEKPERHVEHAAIPLEFVLGNHDGE